MLLAFEVLQEAGLRLPSPIGATGVHPGRAGGGQCGGGGPHRLPGGAHRGGHRGVAGHTMPSQDFAAAPAAVERSCWPSWPAPRAVRTGGGLRGADLSPGQSGDLRGALSGSLHRRGGTAPGHPNLLRPPPPRMKWRTGPDIPKTGGISDEETTGRRSIGRIGGAAGGLRQGRPPLCPGNGDMALLRTMGVDTGEKDGDLRVTVSTGRRAAGSRGRGSRP